MLRGLALPRAAPAVTPPQLFEALEPRVVLATVIWDGGPAGNGNQLDLPANWVGDVLPGPGDIALINSAGPLIELFGGRTFEVGALRIEQPQGGTRQVRIISTARLIINGPDDTRIGPGGELIIGSGLSGNPANLEGDGRIVTLAAFNQNPAGILTLQSGTIAVSSSTIVNHGVFVGGGNLGRSLLNENGGLARLGALTLDGSAVIRNDFGGTLRFETTSTLSRSGSGEVSNFGLAERLPGSTGYTITAPFINQATGRVAVHAGIFQIAGEGSANLGGGVMTVHPGATLRLGHNVAGTTPFLHQAGSRLVADGTLELQGPHNIHNDQFTPTTWEGFGTLVLTGNGVKTFVNDLTIETVTVRFALNSGGTAGARVTIPGQFIWASGSGAIGNSVIVAFGGLMSWIGSSHVLTGTLVNESTDPSNAYVVPAGTFVTLTFQSGRFENRGRFTFDFRDTGTLPVSTSAASSGANHIVNTGEMTIMSAGPRLRLGPTFTFDNPGVLHVESGGLEVQGAIAQVVGGRLTGGEWNVTGPAFINAPQKVSRIGASARVNFFDGANASLFIANNQNIETEPDSVLGLTNTNASTTGAFTHGGNFRLVSGSLYVVASSVNLPASRTRIEASGTGAQFGRIQASGSVTLDGILDFGFGAGFEPSLGETYPFLSAGSRFGQYSSAILPDLSAQGLQTELEYTPTGALIRIVPHAGPQTIRWTGLGDGFDWFDPSNWNLQRVPSANDHVIISDVPQTTQIVVNDNFRNVTIASLVSEENIEILRGDFQIEGLGSSVVQSLLVVGATLVTNGSLTAHGEVEVFGGTLRGPGAFTFNDTLILGPSTVIFDFANIEASGGVHWIGGDIRVSGSAFTLPSGATWRTTTVGTSSLTSLLASTFTLNGTMIHEGPGEASFTGPDFQFVQGLSSSIDVQAGGLTIFDGTFSGVFLGTPIASYRLAGDTNLTPSLRLVGNYDVIFDPGTFQLRGDFNSYTGSIRVNAGALARIGTNISYAGPVALDGALTVEGGIRASFSGEFTGSGDMFIERQAEATFDAGQTITPNMHITGFVIAPGGITLAGNVDFKPGSDFSVTGDLNIAPSAVISLDQADAAITGAVNVRGRLSISGGLLSAAALTNHGTGQIDGQSANLSISGRLTNLGRITGNRFQAVTFADWINLGEASLGEESRIETSSALFNHASATINLGPRSELIARGGAENDGEIALESSTATLGQVAQTGFLNRGLFTMTGTGNRLDIAGSVGNDAVIILHGADLSISHDYTGTGDSRFTLGGVGAGVDILGSVVLSDAARIILEGGGIDFTVGDDLLLGPTTTIDVEITDLAQHWRIAVGGQASLDGALNARYAPGFEPERPRGEGVRFRLIDASTITGDFTDVILPTPPEGDKSVYIRGSNFVEILSTNIADFDEDGFLTIFDFLLFGNLWSIGDPRADLDQSTGPGVFDIFDFIAFGNYFSRG